MRFDNCPTCVGHKTIAEPNPDLTGEIPNVPCPTCRDSEGEPTGRIAVLSEASLIALAMGLEDSGHWQTIQENAEKELMRLRNKREEDFQKVQSKFRHKGDSETHRNIGKEGGGE